MSGIQTYINYFGCTLSKSDIKKIISKDNSQEIELKINNLSSFFEIDISNFSEEVLDRYVDLSPLEAYHPITPYSEQLMGRLFGPLKSAKRCYCFGEYLATIELSAHVAEMLASLVWEMNSVSFNGEQIDKTFEKNVLGNPFEKMGQERRIKVLKGLGLINDIQAQFFDNLRTIRRKYFHLWSEDFSKMQEDARCCYFEAMKLIKSILQIGLSKDKPGAIAMNPLLLQYMAAHGDGSELRLDDIDDLKREQNKKY